MLTDLKKLTGEQLLLVSVFGGAKVHATKPPKTWWPRLQSKGLSKLRAGATAMAC